MLLGWCGGGQPVGETRKRPFQLSFNSALRVDFQGARVTSDGGLLLVRELDEWALERTHGAALERFPPGQEYPVASGRPAAAVDPQALGGFGSMLRRIAMLPSPAG